MKKFSAAILLSSFITSTPMYAVDLTQGFYGSLFGEVSHGPSSDNTIFTEDGSAFHGVVKFSNISGGAGFTLGYRYNQFRAEGEFLFNRISTGPVTVGTCTIENVDVVSPTGICTPGVYDSFQAKGLGFSGSSTALYGLINGIFDLEMFDSTTNVTPYLGVGFGTVSIKNGTSFINTVAGTSHGYTPTSRSTAMQGILGVSYYMDDYTWATMDFRYLAASRKALSNHVDAEVIPSKAYNLSTLNFGVGFAFDR
jgi:opacity protein-like surface antigen